MNYGTDFRLKARNVTIPSGVEGATYWHYLSLTNTEKLYLPDNIEPSALYGSLRLYPTPVFYCSADSRGEDFARGFGWEFVTVDT